MLAIMLEIFHSLLRHRLSSPSAVVPLLLTIALLGSQMIAVQHVHDGDLAHHLECSICAKQSSETDFLPPSVGVPDVVQSDSESGKATLTGFSREPLTARSRAPPLS